MESIIEVIHNVRIKAQQRIKDIDCLLDLVKKYKIKQGKPFKIDDGRKLICMGFDDYHCDIHVGFCQEGKTIYHDSEIFSLKLVLGNLKKK